MPPRACPQRSRLNGTAGGSLDRPRGRRGSNRVEIDSEEMPMSETVRRKRQRRNRHESAVPHSRRRFEDPEPAPHHRRRFRRRAPQAGDRARRPGDALGQSLAHPRRIREPRRAGPTLPPTSLAAHPRRRDSPARVRRAVRKAFGLLVMTAPCRGSRAPRHRPPTRSKKVSRLPETARRTAIPPGPFRLAHA